MKSFGFFLCVCVLFLIVPLVTVAAAGNQESTDAGAEEKELAILAISGGAFEGLRPEIELFEQEYNAKVGIDDAPWQNYVQKLLVAINSGGLYDAVAFSANHFLPAVRADYLMPLASVDGKTYSTNDMISRKIDVSRFTDSALSGMIVDGELYGLPWFYNVNLGYYRTDVFEKHGLEWPTTWDEFYDVAKALTNEDEGFYGASLPLKQGNHSATEFVQHLASRGGVLVDDEYNVQFNGPAGVEALEYMKMLYDEGVISPNSVEYTYYESEIAFLQGRSAMTFYWGETIRNAQDEEKSQIIGNWAVAQRPGVAISSGWGWGVTSETKNVDLAADFVEFATSVDQGVAQTLIGKIPVVKLDLIKDRLPEDSLSNLEISQKSLGPALDQITIPEYSVIRTAISEALSNVMATQMPIQEALDKAAQSVNDHFVEIGLK